MSVQGARRRLYPLWRHARARSRRPVPGVQPFAPMTAVPVLPTSRRELLDAPLATAEFLAVDTETNGLARERCELTEVGAVLVGGGELHERWSSLVGVSMPLGRGIQRFTGITQAMLEEAPPPEAVLPELARRLHGRVLVAQDRKSVV